MAKVTKDEAAAVARYGPGRFGAMKAALEEFIRHEYPMAESASLVVHIGDGIPPPVFPLFATPASLKAVEDGRRRAGNVARAKLFSDRLRQTLLDYHNRQLDAAAVVAELVRMRRELRADADRAAALDLLPEELAFYDAVATRYGPEYDAPTLRGLVHDVVRTLKANLKADWHGGDRPQVSADLRAAVRRTLRQHGVKAEHLDLLADRVIEQAEHTFADWPLLAA